ncbi:hypothetical protein BH23VER1_BH23VER1_18350 [soil metagenome]
MKSHHSTPASLVRLPVLRAVALSAFLAAPLSATTINFGSSVDALNICSDGSQLDSSFTFQLGTFAAGFVPTAGNYAQWAARWVPLAGEDGTALASATVRYDDSLLLTAGGTDIFTNSFSGTTELTHNVSPFVAGTQAYIFAFNGQDPASSTQWIVLVDPTWRWPDTKLFSPPHGFGVGETTGAIAGRANDAATGAELVAAATGAATPAQEYAEWTAAHFPAVIVKNPRLARIFLGMDGDPDRDGLSNLTEYFLGSDPLMGDGVSPFGIRSDPDRKHVRISFARSKSASAVSGGVQHSSSLAAWGLPKPAEVVIEDAGATEIITLRIPLASSSAAGFFRLRVAPK